MESFFLFTLDDLEFPKTKVDVEEIRGFESEDQFMSLAVELLNEVAQITMIFSHAYRLDDTGNPRKWKRNEAILGGLMVRISKLQRAILDQTCQKRLEIVEILFRCLMESIVNLIYLIKENSKELFDGFVNYSLELEKKLLENVDENINKRGNEIPIEVRIKSSVDRAFRRSQVSPEYLDKSQPNPWKNTNLYERVKRIGTEESYLGLFGLPCHAVHGNWQDIMTYHLEYEDGFFSPKTEWSCPRPQPLFVSALLSLEANMVYANEIIPSCDDKEEIKKLLYDIIIRGRIADELHEEFLKERTKPPSK